VCVPFVLSAEPTPAPVCGGFGAFVVRVGSVPVFAAAPVFVVEPVVEPVVVFVPDVLPDLFVPPDGVADAFGALVWRLRASSA
jgi:hypothetical protein